jgi:hypothetical protein
MPDSLFGECSVQPEDYVSVATIGLKADEGVAAAVVAGMSP